MDDLAAWLTQIWDEREMIAGNEVDVVAEFFPASKGYEHSYRWSRWTYLDGVGPSTSMMVGAPSPTEVLARIAADRQILALHQPDREPDTWYWLERECKECRHRWHANTPAGTPPTVIGPETGCPTVRLLALPYADWPGYQEAWRPGYQEDWKPA